MKDNAELKNFAPNIWAMYRLLFDGRSKLEDRLNYFLGINTLFIIGYLQLFLNEIKSLSIIHIFPLILLIIPVILLLLNFFTGPGRLPWFTKEQLTKCIENESLYVNWVAAIYNCAYATFYYQKDRVRLLKICLLFIGLALLWMIIFFIIKINMILPEFWRQPSILISSFLIMGLIGSVGLSLQRKKAYKDQTKEVFDYLLSWSHERGTK